MGFGPEYYLQQLAEPDVDEVEDSIAPWSSDPPTHNGMYTSPTPHRNVGGSLWGNANGNSYQHYQHQANGNQGYGDPAPQSANQIPPPHPIYGSERLNEQIQYENDQIHQGHQVRVPRTAHANDNNLPLSVENSAQSSSDPSFGRNITQALQGTAIHQATDSRPQAVKGKEDEYDLEDANWLSEIDLKAWDQAPQLSSSFDPLPSADIKDDEPVVTAEMLKERERKQVEIEKKRKEETTLNGQMVRKPVVSTEGMIEVASIENGAYIEVFKFKYLNLVQSKVFHTAFETDENLVISSPTGSGKTTIFDLAYLRMIRPNQPLTDMDSRTTYAIYFAPTKALCSERCRDWNLRLKDDEHGAQMDGPAAIEVTGDTSNPSAVLKRIKQSRLVVTTPEKWESLTRRGKGDNSGESRLALIMIDEVHFLRDTRGATLEVVVSRLKAADPSIRIVALSATVPNIDDIARWLGPKKFAVKESGNTIYEREDGQEIKSPVDVPVHEMPKATVFTFGEEYRPVKLVKQVIGFDVANEWVLSSRLDKELWSVLLKYAAGKPVLVFCPTRKACQSTAAEIAHQWRQADKDGKPLPWKVDRQKSRSMIDSKLGEYAAAGIAFHHAGLDSVDRHTVENMFTDGGLMLIVSTSTLAVGVNLPAHTVVIKGTSSWQGPVTGFKEYSDIEVQQMMGRAGRPQFDDSGTCIIMCDSKQKNKFQNILNHKTIVESSLHLNLTEHINSEIGLGTIKSIESAKNWLRNSFLFVRIRQKPSFYASSLSKDKQKSWKETLDHYVEDAIKKLRDNTAVHLQAAENDDDDDDVNDSDCESQSGEARRKPNSILQLTRYGRIMNDNVISFETLCRILKMEPRANVRDLLHILSGATEFSDIRIRQGEQGVLNILREHEDIRYPLTEPAESYADKVFLYLQALYGNIEMEDKKSSENASIKATIMVIYKDAPRIAKAIASVAKLKAETEDPSYGKAVKSALELTHTILGKAWENNAAVFRQLDNIGPKSIGKLNAVGVTTFDQLLNTDAGQIEFWLKRLHPYGMEVHRGIHSLPRYSGTAEIESVEKLPGRRPIVTVRITVEAKGDFTKLNKKQPKNGRKSHQPFYNLSILTLRNDGNMIDFRRMPARKLTAALSTFTVQAELEDIEQRIEVHVGVDEVAGCSTKIDLAPNLDFESHFEDIEESAYASSEEDEEVAVKPTCGPKKRDPSDRSPSPTVMKSKMGRKSEAEIDYKETIANIAKPKRPRASHQEGEQPSRSKTIVSKPKPIVIRPKKSARAKKEPLFLPSTSYIDDEAIESDDDGSDESMNSEDRAFINDDDSDTGKTRKRKTRNHKLAVKKPRKEDCSTLPSLADAFRDESPRPDRRQGGRSKRQELHLDSSSDEMDGIESVKSDEVIPVPRGKVDTQKKAVDAANEESYPTRGRGRTIKQTTNESSDEMNGIESPKDEAPLPTRQRQSQTKGRFADPPVETLLASRGRDDRHIEHRHVDQTSHGQIFSVGSSEEVESVSARMSDHRRMSTRQVHQDGHAEDHYTADEAQHHSDKAYDLGRTAEARDELRNDSTGEESEDSDDFDLDQYIQQPAQETVLTTTTSNQVQRPLAVGVNTPHPAQDDDRMDAYVTEAEDHPAFFTPQEGSSEAWLDQYQTVDEDDSYSTQQYEDRETSHRQHHQNSTRASLSIRAAKHASPVIQQNGDKVDEELNAMLSDEEYSDEFFDARMDQDDQPTPLRAQMPVAVNQSSQNQWGGNDRSVNVDRGRSGVQYEQYEEDEQYDEGEKDEEDEQDEQGVQDEEDELDEQDEGRYPAMATQHTYPNVRYLYQSPTQLQDGRRYEPKFLHATEIPPPLNGTKQYAVNSHSRHADDRDGMSEGQYYDNTYDTQTQEQSDLTPLSMSEHSDSPPQDAQYQDYADTRYPKQYGQAEDDGPASSAYQHHDYEEDGGYEYDDHEMAGVESRSGVPAGYGGGRW